MQLDSKQNAYCASDQSSNACSAPMNGQQGCNCVSQTHNTKSAVLLEKPISIEETRWTIQRHTALLKLPPNGVVDRKSGGFHQNIRGGVMLGIACITSPCCTPLIVPAILALLAGTPVALWLAQNVGWIYGGLTMVSTISLVLGLRWIWQKLSIQDPSKDQLPVTTGENRVVSTPIPLRESAIQPVLSQSIQPSKEK